MTSENQSTNKTKSSQSSISIELEEIGGTSYNDVSDAQAALLPGLARCLAEIIRAGLDSGQLRITNGYVTR